jgi:hypothetical protein
MFNCLLYSFAQVNMHVEGAATGRLDISFIRFTWSSSKC